MDRSPFEFDGVHEDLVSLNGSNNTWFPLNLSEVINGGGEPPPSLLEFKPNRCLFYPGKVNGIYGQPECGKSWLVCYALKQVLDQGGSIWYIDFEDSGHTFVNRLRNLGVPDSVIVSDRCQYSRPDETSVSSVDQIKLMVSFSHFDIIVVDSLNEAMWNDGMNPESNTDCGIYTKRLFTVLTSTGSCVISVDHEPKNSNGSSYQFGGQQKKAMIRGSLIHMKNTKPFGRGLSGESFLEVSKDTPGYVRAETLDGSSLGTLTLSSDLLTGNCTIKLDAPTTAYDKVWDDVTSFVRQNPRCKTTEIRNGVTGGNDMIGEVLKEMSDSGFILSVKERTTRLHWLPDPCG